MKLPDHSFPIAEDFKLITSGYYLLEPSNKISKDKYNRD